MKKIQKDSKTLLFENMIKLNPDFKLNKTILTETDDKWIQNAINPKHKGFCSPESKSTCTPRRKALAKRFKKGISEDIGNEYDETSQEFQNAYRIKVEKLKAKMDELIKHNEYGAIDSLYRLLVDRKSQNSDANKYAVAEESSLNYSNPEQKRKAELLKGKIDFLFDTKKWDILNKVDKIISQLFPESNNTENEFGEMLREIKETVDRTKKIF
jgi:hypothetical protein